MDFQKLNDLRCNNDITVEELDRIIANGSGVAYSVKSGDYVKVNNLVTLSIKVVVATQDGSNYTKFGLPLVFNKDS